MDNLELIICIVNTGFSEIAMDAARKHGARGGTIINGRGTATKEAEKIFNITIQPEKEIIIILVNTNIKDKILKGLYDEVGVNTAAQGIAFTLPVEDVVGISSSQNRKDKK